MPNYKVVDADQLDADLESVADAIRSKTGMQESLDFPAEFVRAVEGIEAGGGGTGGSDVVDALINGSITEISSDAAAIREFAFRGCTALASASFPLATEVGQYAFYGCTALSDFAANVVKTINSYAFYGCTRLISLNLPRANTLGTYAFRGCTALCTAYFPLLGSVPASAFYGCSALTIADTGLSTSIAAQAFYNCYTLKALVLRGAAVATLANVNALTNCYWLKGTTNMIYNPNGGQGYVYVPADLVETYAATTNWVSAGVQFRALDDYTLDGTPAGELNISKMLDGLGGSGDYEIM